MHYYQFNIGDYRRDTSHLSRLEHSIYRDLIDWYYLDELPIPLETQSVIRRLRLGSQEEATALQNILNDFFECESDGWHHNRIDADLQKYRHDCIKNRNNGKKGGRPKALSGKEENPLGSQSVSTENPNLTQNNPNQEPITKNQEPIKPPLEFDTFWKAYPKKVGKPDCIKIWNRKRPPIDQVMKTLDWQKKSKQWIDGYIPNPSTYLNQGRWTDEPILEQQPKKAWE